MILAECATELGGSGRFAEYLHAAPSVDVLRTIDPGALPHMQDGLVAGFGEATDWVASLGAGDYSELVTVYRMTRGNVMDTNRYIVECAGLIGTDRVLLGASVEQLTVTDGAVRGARVTTVGGKSLPVTARSTLLATGGIQRDPDLVCRYIHPQGDAMPGMGNAMSRGAGLRLGLSVGGVAGPEGAMFYGHLVPYGVTPTDPMDGLTLSQGYSTHGLLFNLRGDRFVDETVNDHVSAMACVEQPGARALLVIDSRVRDQWMLRSAFGHEVVDKFDVALKRGARAALAHDLTEFRYLPDEWGYPGAAIEESIRCLNDVLAGGEPTDPVREFDRDPLLEPPYYVMEVVPGITFAYAGLLVDAGARVLDADGNPIPGLLAAGADAGGTFSREYGGGLANAIVFGLAAAKTALQT